MKPVFSVSDLVEPAKMDCVGRSSCRTGAAGSAFKQDLLERTFINSLRI